jgi:hypothetical protein
MSRAKGQLTNLQKRLRAKRELQKQRRRDGCCLHCGRRCDYATICDKCFSGGTLA